MEQLWLWSNAYNQFWQIKVIMLHITQLSSGALIWRCPILTPYLFYSLWLAMSWLLRSNQVCLIVKCCVNIAWWENVKNNIFYVKKIRSWMKILIFLPCSLFPVLVQFIGVCFNFYFSSNRKPIICMCSSFSWQFDHMAVIWHFPFIQDMYPLLICVCVVYKIQLKFIIGSSSRREITDSPVSITRWPELKFRDMLSLCVPLLY